MTRSAKGFFLYATIAVTSFSIGVFATIMIVRPGYYGVQDNTFSGSPLSAEESAMESIDIFDIPPEVFTKRDLQRTRLSHNPQWETVYLDGTGYRNITYQHHKVSSLEFSPIKGDKLGFTYYPDDNSVTDIVLAIMNIPERTIKEVYRKTSSRTSNWEWDGTKRVIVYYNGGTGVLYAYKIDVETGETVDEYHEYQIMSINRI